MKKDGILKLSALLTAFSMGTALSGAAGLSVSDFEINPGGTHTESVSITPPADGMFEYKGFQFDLVLTADISVDMEETQLLNPLSSFILYGKTIDGNICRMLVYTEGADVATATSNLISIAFKAADNAAPGPNIININDVIFSTPLGNERYLGNSYFTVTVTEEPVGPEVPETPSVPTDYVPQGWHGNGNGTWVSALKIREGDLLGMGVNQPTGGYPDGFDFVWTNPLDAIIGEEAEIWSAAELFGEAASAKGQAISTNSYDVTITNYDPDGAEFWQTTLPTADVKVYKRPQIPTQLLRKGQLPGGGQTPETGTSCTFVVMMTPLSNQEILDLGYWYVYGYTDADGMMHELDNTQLRYTHTTPQIYNNPSFNFWAYSYWNYPDGSIVTSGLRYLDGSEDPDFNAGSFDGTRVSGVTDVEAEEVLTGIYTLDGRYMGTDSSRLEHGVYIMRFNNSSKKVIL